MRVQVGVRKDMRVGTSMEEKAVIMASAVWRRLEGMVVVIVVMVLIEEWFRTVLDIQLEGLAIKHGDGSVGCVKTCAGQQQKPRV